MTNNGDTEQEEFNRDYSKFLIYAAKRELHDLVLRYERIEVEKAELNDAQKAIMTEAKARGHDTKALRKLIAERKRDQFDVAIEEKTLELYRQAMRTVETEL